VRRAQQNLDDIVMGRRPVPFRPQPPTVDDIADQVDGLSLIVTQEVDQAIALAAAVSEMHVRQKQRAISARPVWQPVVVYLEAESHGSTMTKSCLRFMTAGMSARPCALTIPKRSRVARFRPAFAAY
jgi:GTP cyclohydrolase FolE2